MSGWGRPAEETAKQTKTMSKPIQSALLTNEGFQRCIQRYNTVKAVGTAEVVDWCHPLNNDGSQIQYTLPEG